MKVGNLVRNTGHVKRGITHVIGVVVETSPDLQIAQVQWCDTSWDQSFMYRWFVLEVISEVKNESK
jgi:hypothetical protein